MGFFGGVPGPPGVLATFLAAKINMLEPRGQFGSRLQGGKAGVGEAFGSGFLDFFDGLQRIFTLAPWHSPDGTYMNQDLYH